MVLRGRRINNFVDFSSNTCSGAMGIWLLTLIFHTSAKGWPPQPLKERVPNIIEKMVFWRSIPQKEAVKMTEAKKITQYLNCLQFLSFLRSKRPSRSSRLLRSSCLMEPMRPLRSSDSLRNLNSIIKWLETSYFVVFKTWFFSVRIMKFQVQLWHPSDLRLWRTDYVIYVKIDW